MLLNPGWPTSMGVEFSTLPITAGLSGLRWLSFRSILPSIHCTIRSVSAALPPIPSSSRAPLLVSSIVPLLAATIWVTLPVASEKKTLRFVHRVCCSSLGVVPGTGVKTFCSAADQTFVVVYLVEVLVACSVPIW